ncbi:MAG: SRPBCC domain-containing protein [Chitinophagales bacterium]
MRTRTIKQQEIFAASPEKLYTMLMDEKVHNAFSGASAKVSKKVGGKFSAYDDYITGNNLVLEKGKRIVQSWHASDMPEGHMSEIEFVFKELQNGQTKIHFTHRQVPADMYDAFAKGWDDFYWQPMRVYIATHPD